MFLFLSRNRKLLSLYFLGLFFLSSNFYGNQLLVEAAKIVVGVTIDDYKCKDHGCGCSTAFKCLTDCCCIVDEPEEVAVICNPLTQPELEVEPESCCSSEPEAKTFVEKIDEIIAENVNDSRTVFIPSRCSSEEFFSFQISQGFLMDIMLDYEYSSEYLFETEWFSLEKFSPQTVTEGLLKVPILG